jgi:pilus assembly protein FimV
MARKIKGIPASSMDESPVGEDSPSQDDLDKTRVRGDATLDLDKYGIWVKAEPEDFKDTASFDDKEMELEDLSLEEEGEVPSADLELDVPEDTGMIDNLDIPEEESLQSLEEVGGENEVSLDEELPSLDETISFDEPAPVLETVIREETSTTADEPGSLEEESAVDLGAGDFEEVSLDDLGIEISDAAPEDEDGITKGPARKSVPAANVDEPKAHIIDDEFAALPLALDDLDDAEKEMKDRKELEIEDLELPEEEPIPLGEDDDSLPLPAEEAAGSLSGEEETLSFEETEEPLGELVTEDAADAPETLEEIPELELGADEGIELDLGGEETGEEIEVPLSEETSIPEAEEELESIGAELDQAEPSPGTSASVLQKIEAELRSIKTELTQLKSELGVLRGRKTAERGEAGGGRQAGAAESGDFFEEEDDETIALTGEELDNILTTADIKEEEKAQPASEEPEETELDLGEDILSYEEAPAAEEAALADASTEELSFDAIPIEEPQSSGGGEIEIEIPELDAGDGEVPDLEASDDLETLDDLEPTGESLMETAGEMETIEPLDEIGYDVHKPAAAPAARSPEMQLPSGLKEEIKSVLGYMDQLLESLPEEKIEEFAKSEYFAIYKKLFEELGLVS